MLTFTLAFAMSRLQMGESVNHIGIVDRIEKERVFVRITQRSACAECHAQGLCPAFERKEKLIEVPDRSGQFSLNEEVMICGESSLGLQAVLLAFVFPFLIVLIAVILGSSLRWAETTSGGVGLALLIPYYGVLYLMREKLKRRFTFTLKKLN